MKLSVKISKFIFSLCVREDKFVCCGGFRKTYETCWRSLISPASPRNPCPAEAGGHFASTASPGETGTEKKKSDGDEGEEDC